MRTGPQHGGHAPQQQSHQQGAEKDQPAHGRLTARRAQGRRARLPCGLACRARLLFGARWAAESSTFRCARRRAAALARPYEHILACGARGSPSRPPFATAFVACIVEPCNWPTETDAGAIEVARANFPKP